MQKGMLGLQLLYIFAWLIGALNYYLLKFRGQPFLATAIYAIRTAIAVAGQYTFEIAEELAFTFLIRKRTIASTLSAKSRFRGFS